MDPGILEGPIVDSHSTRRTVDIAAKAGETPWAKCVTGGALTQSIDLNVGNDGAGNPGRNSYLPATDSTLADGYVVGIDVDVS